MGNFMCPCHSQLIPDLFAITRNLWKSSSASLFSPFQFIGRARGLDCKEGLSRRWCPEPPLASIRDKRFIFAIMIPDELPNGSPLTWTEDA